VRLHAFPEKGSDPFDMLPEGWVLITHNSGMPVYLHKESRVVTFSKPYFIGPGSVRVSVLIFLWNFILSSCLCSKKKKWYKIIHFFSALQFEH
jgi:hypothetical protein